MQLLGLGTHCRRPDTHQLRVSGRGGFSGNAAHLSELPYHLRIQARGSRRGPNAHQREIEQRESDPYLWHSPDCIVVRKIDAHVDALQGFLVHRSQHPRYPFPQLLHLCLTNVVGFARNAGWRPRNESKDSGCRFLAVFWAHRDPSNEHAARASPQAKNVCIRGSFRLVDVWHWLVACSFYFSVGLHQM